MSTPLSPENVGRNTLNNKIELAWLAARGTQPKTTAERRKYQTGFIRALASELSVDLDRVRQRVQKIERRLTGAPHCSTCTCGDIPNTPSKEHDRV